MRHDGGNTLNYQDNHEELKMLPRNAMECELLILNLGYTSGLAVHDALCQKVVTIEEVCDVLVVLHR
jgi:hypothetical protein